MNVVIIYENRLLIWNRVGGYILEGFEGRKGRGNDKINLKF